MVSCYIYQPSIKKRGRFGKVNIKWFLASNSVLHCYSFQVAPNIFAMKPYLSAAWSICSEQSNTQVRQTQNSKSKLQSKHYYHLFCWTASSMSSLALDAANYWISLWAILQTSAQSILHSLQVTFLCEKV